MVTRGLLLTFGGGGFLFLLAGLTDIRPLFSDSPPHLSFPPQGEDILFGCAVILLVILNYWMA